MPFFPQTGHALPFYPFATGPQTFQRIAVDWLNVRDFGANPNDVADCAPAIQAAHDALPAQGGVIYIPPSGAKFAVASTVVITKPVLIFGGGPNTIVRANAAITAVFELRAGAQGSVITDLRIEGNKNGAGGTIQRGVLINGAQNVTIERVQFSGPANGTGLNFGVDVNGALSAYARIAFCRFERTVSSGSNGTAILLEATNNCQVVGNIIDGTNANNADGAIAAAIFLSQAIGGVGCSYNLIQQNRISAWPQVGISMNSTTYADFSGDLGQSFRNTIDDNEIFGCTNAAGGAASSGIYVTSNAAFNRISRNRVYNNGHANGGYGIAMDGVAGLAKTVTAATNATPIVVTSAAHGFATNNVVGVSGVLGNTAANGVWTITVIDANTFSLNTSVGNGAYTGGGKVGITGTAKIDEVPSYNEIVDNFVAQNKEDGIRLNGCTNMTVRGNFCYENGQKTANTYGNIRISRVAAAGPTGNSNLIQDNKCVGAQPQYQVKILAGPTGCYLVYNLVPVAATGSVNDLGTTTTVTGNLT